MSIQTEGNMIPKQGSYVDSVISNIMDLDSTVDSYMLLRNEIIRPRPEPGNLDDKICGRKDFPCGFEDVWSFLPTKFYDLSAQIESYTNEISQVITGEAEALPVHLPSPVHPSIYSDVPVAKANKIDNLIDSINTLEKAIILIINFRRSLIHDKNEPVCEVEDMSEFTKCFVDFKSSNSFDYKWRGLHDIISVSSKTIRNEILNIRQIIFRNVKGYTEKTDIKLPPLSILEALHEKVPVTIAELTKELPSKELPYEKDWRRSYK